MALLACALYSQPTKCAQVHSAKETTAQHVGTTLSI